MDLRFISKELEDCPRRGKLMPMKWLEMEEKSEPQGCQHPRSKSWREDGEDHSGGHWEDTGELLTEDKGSQTSMRDPVRCHTRWLGQGDDNLLEKNLVTSCSVLMGNHITKCGKTNGKWKLGHPWYLLGDEKKGQDEFAAGADARIKKMISLWVIWPSDS